MKAIRTILALIKHYEFRSIPIIWRSITFALARWVPGLHIVQATVYNYNMLVPVKDDGIGRALYVYRGRELDHKWILEKVLHPGDVILDLGANIGYYVILEASILNSNCKIFAIEPDPRNIAVLHRNLEYLKLNRIVTVENGAISNYSGTADLISRDKTNLSKLRTENSNTTDGTYIKVQVTDFADYLSRISAQVDVVRMDIEGGEVKVLESLANMLKNNKHQLLPKRIVFETHNYRTEEENMRDILIEILNRAYSIEYITSDDELHDRPVIRSYGYEPITVISEFKVSRGIYDNVKKEDGVSMISKWKGTRTICLRLNDSLSRQSEDHCE